MKKLFLLTCLSAALLFTNSYAQEKKVAVVSFYTVKQIGITQFGSAAAIAPVDSSTHRPADWRPSPGPAAAPARRRS